MRVLTADFTGPETILSIDESDIPEVGPYDILVRVKACALNLHNEKTYNQLLAPSPKRCPLGHDVSGEVVKIGAKVDAYKEGMAVVGTVPFDSKVAGCCEYTLLSQFDAVEKPPSLSFETAAASVGAGLAAYTAIHYLGHVTAGDTVLVIDGASPEGYLTIQTAQAWGAKVLSTYKTLSERQFLESIKPPVAQLIELTQRTNILASSVMEETGGIGVDCIVDKGVRLFTSEEDKDLMGERNLRTIPHKHDIISCLGFSGKWITSQPNLQLDPPDSQQLFFRGASVSFLFPPAWTLMRSQHGRYQHILRDLIDRLGNGEIKCNDVLPFSLDKAPDAVTQKDLDSIKCIVIVP
jgi:NADPH:quinone reductase-like Zn-dependent oxidoreductase